MVEITWASDYNPDGSRRRPKANGYHGWMTKWRGTFSGDERLRTRGMREIKEAKAIDRWRARRAKSQAKAKARGSSGGLLSFLFGRKKSKPAANTRGSTRPRGTVQRRHTATGAGSTPRPQPPQRRATNASARPTASRQSSRSGQHGNRPPPPMRRRTTRGGGGGR